MLRISCVSIFVVIQSLTTVLYSQVGTNYLAGEIYMLGNQFIYKIVDRGTSLQISEFIDIPPGHKGTMTFDPYRKLLVLIKGNQIIGYDFDGNVFPLFISDPSDPPILVTAGKNGNLYFYSNLSGLNTLDKCGRLRSVNNTVVASTFGNPYITTLFFHKETNSIFIGLSRDEFANISIIRLELSPEGFESTAPFQEQIYRVSGQQLPVSMSYGPMKCPSQINCNCPLENCCKDDDSKRLLMVFVDKNSIESSPNMLVFDPDNFTSGMRPYYNFGGVGSNTFWAGLFPTTDRCQESFIPCICCNVGSAIGISVVNSPEACIPGTSNPKKYSFKRFHVQCASSSNGSGVDLTENYFGDCIDLVNSYSANPLIQIREVSDQPWDRDCDGSTTLDNCPECPNGTQEDQDGDGIGDACDLCLCDPLNTCVASMELNSGLSFDGGSFVNIPHNNSLNLVNALTAEAWIKLEGATNDHQNIVRKNNNYILGYVASHGRSLEVQVRPVSPGSWKRLHADLPPNLIESKWIHVAMTYESGDFRLYINGALNDHTSEVIGPLMTSDHPLHLGSVSYDVKEFFKGSLDEVRLWNYVRSPYDIVKFMNLRLDGSEQGLVGYWNFDEINGSQIIDKSPNANHGMLTGGILDPAVISVIDATLVLNDFDQDSIGDICSGGCNSSQPSSNRCLADVKFYNLVQSDRRIRNLHRRFQNSIELSNLINSRSDDLGIIQIPVVFHIIHNGQSSPEYLTDSLVKYQMGQISDDFRRLNSDTNNTPQIFADLAADCEIQFDLAQRDPSGRSTTGIIRHHIDSVPGFSYSSCWNSDNIDNNLIIPLHWNSKDYLNVFVVHKIDESDCSESGILGYAQLPGFDSHSDAIVCLAEVIGSLENPNPLESSNTFNKGRTLTHEIGHWLNLRHIWGPDDHGCLQDDLITDTPLQCQPTHSCSDSTLFDLCTSTGGGIMFMNYMDYNDDDCFNLFTLGQKRWMRESLLFFRPEILTSKGHIKPDCPQALDLNEPEISPYNYYAEELIQSSGGVTTGSVFFHSMEVDLEPPFSVDLESTFEIILIDGCP